MTHATEAKISTLVDDLHAPEEDTPEARSRVYRWFSENLPSRVVVGIDPTNGHDKSAMVLGQVQPDGSLKVVDIVSVTDAIAEKWEADMMECGSGETGIGLTGLLADQGAMLQSPSPPGQQEALNSQHSLPDPDCIRPGRGEFVPTPPSDLERDRDYYKALHAMDQTMIAVLVAEWDYFRGLVDDLTLGSISATDPAPAASKTPHNPFREHPDDRRRIGSLLGSIA